jgi:hypothetical protein
LSRVGATIIHVANGATMARGWYAARVERRWSRLFLAYLASVSLHAAWNGLAIGQIVGAPQSPNPQTLFDLSSPGSIVSVVIAFGLIVLALGGVGWIAYSVNSARAQPSASMPPTLVP